MILLVFIILMVNNSWGHGNEKHSSDKVMNKEKKDLFKNKLIYEKINSQYLKKIKPIFQKSCFDCHSSRTVFPWYYSLPIVKQVIDSDIKEAKSHLDFSNNYPFKSHDTPENDLKSIMKSISDASMPPSQYLFFHGDKKMSDSEKTKVKEWVKNSLKALDQN